MNQSPSEELEILRKYIHTYSDELNLEGVWLFLASLGCWSAAAGLPQIFATVLTGALFFQRFNLKRTEKRHFALAFKEILVRADREVPDQVERSRIQLEIRFLRDNYLAFGPVLKRAWPFLGCWAFYGITVVHTFTPSVRWWGA